MTMSNVIDLEARRRLKTRQPFEGRRRGANVLAVSGFVILLSSVALLSFVAYQAVRLQILADTFVIGLFMALATYLAVGSAFLHFGKRPTWTPTQQQNDETASSAPDKVDDPFTLVEFPTAGPIAGGWISIRCTSCANRYLASSTNLLCPTCGRAALAG